MFCKNCGKEISDDTKFCNHCGAAQDSSSAQPSAQPVQPAAPAPQPGTAPKKNPITLVIIAAVVIVAIVLGMFVIAPAMSGNKEQAPTGESSVTAGNNTTGDEASNPDNGDSNEVKPPAEGNVNKCKVFELKRADNDAISIELFYRDGSDYVADVSGRIYIPAGSSEYDSMLADTIAFDEKVKALNLPEDIMQFGYTEIKLEDGYLENHFAFQELDASNASNVAMVAEFLGLPTQDGYFKLSDCEQYLLESGLELTHEQ